MAKVTIILKDLEGKGGGVDMSVHFDPEPTGTGLTPAQVVASDLLTLLRGKIAAATKDKKKAPAVGAKG